MSKKAMTDTELENERLMHYVSIREIEREQWRREQEIKKKEEEKRLNRIRDNRPQQKPYSEWRWDCVAKTAEKILDVAAKYGWDDYDEDNHRICGIGTDLLEQLMDDVIEAIYGDIGEWPDKP